MERQHGEPQTTNNIMFKAQYTVVHTEGASNGMAFHRSPKRAVEIARRMAWEDHDRINPNNWADVWLTLTNPYGKVIFNDWGNP